MLTEKHKIEYLRKSILQSMSLIENIKLELFHNIMPEIDMEFNEISYKDYTRLRSIDINLKHYIDDLQFERAMNKE